MKSALMRVFVTFESYTGFLGERAGKHLFSSLIVFDDKSLSEKLLHGFFEAWVVGDEIESESSLA